jgi:TonB family protein
MVIYLLKINVVLMLLYGFYRLMYNRDTFFGWRRSVLIGIYLVSLLIPAMNMEYWVQEHATTVSMAHTYAEVVLPSITVTAVQPVFSWMDAIRYIYLCGVALLFARFLWQLVTIFYLVRTTSVKDVDGIDVHVIKGNGSPFSFFGWIFANPDNHTSEQFNEILIHESTHAEQIHSFDMMMAEIFTIFCWFNPFAWLMKREVRMNLEFLADNSVLENGNDQKTYQYHLLGLSYHKNVATISNNFNVLPLKKRIKMMNKKRTREIGKAKYLLFAPLAATLLIASNIESVARVISEKVPVTTTIANKTQTVLNDNILPEKLSPKAMASSTELASPAEDAVQDTVINGKTYREVKKDASGDVYDVVENLPSFPGGPQALLQWISENMQYPDAAKKAGIKGRVIVTFVVRSDGRITDARVIRGVDPSLDAEALRLINSMPKWTPGVQDGKAVNVRYNVPFSFKLSSEKIQKSDNSASQSHIE